MRWFTSDHHFFHYNIIKFCNRPFSNDLEMNEILISNWNSVISNKDEVYHLGDLAFDAAQVNNILPQLNGKIYILKGNHDKWWNDFNEIKDKLVKLPTQVTIDFTNKILVTLNHYPMRSWEQSHYGAWHLYGHIHSKGDNFGYSFDVGVDANNYMPISFDEVHTKMQKVNETPYTVYERKYGK